MNNNYEAEVAQKVYEQRRASCIPAGKFTPKLAAELQESLNLLGHQSRLQKNVVAKVWLSFALRVCSKSS